ncbi:ATPase, partial [mine drainage metagenome]
LAILGVRRSGKSVLTWLMLKDKKFGYVDFFDERLTTLRSDELAKIIQAFFELYSNVDYFVFDEIQRVQGWERFVSRLRTSKRIVITGSNSGLLRGNLSTFITGRHSDIVLFPFSFREFLKTNGIELDQNWDYSDDKKAMVKRFLNEFIIKGGFPEAQKFGTGILQGIYRDIVENDIIQQHKIRNREAIRNLSLYLASNICKEISFEKLTGFLGIKNGHTVAKYIGYLEEAYMFFLLQRFSFKLKEQFIAPKKVYV